MQSRGPWRTAHHQPMASATILNPRTTSNHLGIYCKVDYAQGMKPSKAGNNNLQASHSLTGTERAGHVCLNCLLAFTTPEHIRRRHSKPKTRLYLY